MPQEPSNAQLDALILGCAQLDWLKVARVLFLVGERCEERKLRFDPDIVAARIIALVQDGSLDGAGDLSCWRLGEICLPS